MSGPPAGAAECAGRGRRRTVRWWGRASTRTRGGLVDTKPPVYVSVLLKKLIAVDEIQYSYSAYFSIVTTWRDPRGACCYLRARPRAPLLTLEVRAAISELVRVLPS
ncbi:unnamed protein product [Closterium sp. Yama58-4]|nr:unnamed protein product [Closterium sp. Yama58-4]